MRQVLGYFKVVSSEYADRIVVASQEVLSDEENVVSAARKVFTLDAVDGEEVRFIDDQRAFTSEAGELFRVDGSCRMEISASMGAFSRRRC